jgi:hypothetical protein
MVSLEYQKYRHGSNPEDRNVGGDPDRPKADEDSPDVIFLDGILKEQETYGISVQYELVRTLFLVFHYRRMHFHSFDPEHLISFRMSFNFGYRREEMRHIFPINY